MTEEEDDGGRSEGVVFFDLFGRNWVENDSHWDEGPVSTPTKSSTRTEERDRMERKKGRKNTDAKPRRVLGEEKEDVGLIKDGPLKLPVIGERAFEELDNELAVQLAKDNHSKTVSDILQKARRSFYQRTLTVKVRTHTRRHVCCILKNVNQPSSEP